MRRKQDISLALTHNLNKLKHCGSLTRKNGNETVINDFTTNKNDGENHVLVYLTLTAMT